jgi:hypothetical protein
MNQPNLYAVVNDDPPAYRSSLDISLEPGELRHWEPESRATLSS